MTVRRPPRALVVSWLALVALLGLTVTLAYQPLGMFNGPIALVIATAKALVVAAIFMELRDRRPLTLAFAGAGVCWLAILLWLASMDFSRRHDFPPSLGTDRVAASLAAEK
jgi:cytochrome c oxidase subunit 4